MACTFRSRGGSSASSTRPVATWSVVGLGPSALVAGDDAKGAIETGESLAVHPKRVEIVLIVAEDLMEQRIGLFTINRSGKKPILDSFKEMPRDGKLEGRFSDLIEGQVGHA